MFFYEECWINFELNWIEYKSRWTEYNIVHVYWLYVVINGGGGGAKQNTIISGEGICVGCSVQYGEG